MGKVDTSGINYDYYRGHGLSLIATQTVVRPRSSVPKEYNNDIRLLFLPREIRFNGKSKRYIP